MSESKTLPLSDLAPLLGEIPPTKEEIYKADLSGACEFILADEIPPEGVDFVFFHGRARGDERALLQYAAKLLKEGKVKQIVLPGYDGQTFDPNLSYHDQYEQGKQKYVSSVGRSGFAQMLDEELDKIGYEPGLNGPIFFTSAQARSTKEENEALLEYVDKNGLKSGVLLAHPHQLPRAMLGMVATINTHHSGLTVYTVHPPETDWDAIVRGSQGQNPMPRRDHALPEAKRILTYQKKGDLATTAQLLDYYNRRDGNLQRMNGLLRLKQTDQNFLADVAVLNEAINLLKPNEI